MWCAHCGEPHPITEKVCPVTALPLDTSLHRPPSAPPPHPMIGSVIDAKYRIVAVLGEGGMGTVFEAQHLLLQRAVALKLMRPTSDPKRGMKRMQQEARIAGAIGHPHICDVYDVGALLDGSPYLVMQRLVGETLADAITRQRKLPVLHAIQIMIEVLSGLHSAHQMNIVHRDLKPQNIFLASRVGCEPLAKVLDFGLSKMMPNAVPSGGSSDLSSVTSLTAVGTVVGTRAYMAPEQITGGEVDARADLFACGVILYETLTGQKPFVGSNGEELATRIVAASPRPVTALRSDLPAEADVVIARALARHREQRYQQATSFQDDLHALREVLSARAAARGPRATAAPSSGRLPSLAQSSTSGEAIDGAAREDATEPSDEVEDTTNVCAASPLASAPAPAPAARRTQPPPALRRIAAPPVVRRVTARPAPLEESVEDEGDLTEVSHPRGATPGTSRGSPRDE